MKKTGKRCICVVTGTRAEYGLLLPLIRLLSAAPDVRMQLIVTGAHLSPEFGLTYLEIEKDGIRIDKKIDILLSSDTAVGVSKSMGLALSGFAEALTELQPDILVLLGDRYEILCAATAATVANVPVAHIHGGERSEGAMDDAFRHAITKMSYLHFTAAEPYRKRVIQLGESPDRVFCVGALGLDSIHSLPLLSRKSFETAIAFRMLPHNLLLTFHPVTLEKNTAEAQFGNILQALDEMNNTGLIITKPNADTGGRALIRMVDKYVAAHPEKAVAFSSMGQLRYFSAIRHVDGVIGNSSSGIIEVPSFHKGTINVGDRQKGRIKAASVIDCDPTPDSIRKALLKLYSKDFQKRLKFIRTPYGDGHTAPRIAEILRKTKTQSLKKSFFDIPFEKKR